VPGPGWIVVVEQPLSEAFGPIYAALWRTGGLVLAGSVFAGLLAFALARRMTGPIRLLEQGTERIGAGQFDHRIRISTGDELERLAVRVNEMAAELAISQERSERIGRLKRFLSPQVAELISSRDGEQLLAGHRAYVSCLFFDLRGFTAFAETAAPEELLDVLRDYHAALGELITEYGGTLEHFAGDGVMVFFNDPLPVEEHELQAVRLALAAQERLAELGQAWRKRGTELDLGVGIEAGYATLGRIGFEGRYDYGAVGPVANLASRLSTAAVAGQILIGQRVFAAVDDVIETAPAGDLELKGFARPRRRVRGRRAALGSPRAREGPGRPSV
jgi:class 3 adenylate cyclase